ncbi:hypothetical protein R3W88_033489 [Solanum pinnatisectum]|uniref:CCHC-type domain-containing protein n=1 Tax=Solanum pinnatisectum TaxID=50273 RepID=A0AAV9K150_9SOLN|nr:hypothetical protein R3W88_033489 [Solanum pinnatisectum]
MIRSDCNNDYWKERFISGLPTYFTEKVRSKIRDRCEGKIPYSQQVYGDLISLISVVAMELYTRWTCGKKGHRSNKCPGNKKKRKKINLLKVDDEVKQKLFSIIEEEEASDTEYSSSEEESDDEEFLNVAHNSASEEEESECNCNGAFCLFDSKTISVISERTAEILFSTIEHIQYEEARRKYLLELQKLVTRQKEEKPKVTPFSMKQIMNRFDSEKEEPSVEELRREVNSLKEEMKGIKSRLHKIEIEAITEKLLKEVRNDEGTSKAGVSDNEEHEEDADSEAGIHAITRIRPQNGGADRNCIIEGLIPTKYLTKGTTKLYSATGERKIMRPVIRPRFGTQGPFKEKEKDTDKKPSASPFAIRPSLNSPNKYSALASLPPINPPHAISPFHSLPPSSSSSNPLILKKPFSKESEPCSFAPSGKPRFSFPQTKDSYTMKDTKSFREAVSPVSPAHNKLKEREVFNMVTLQVNPILALDKEFENYEVKHLLKPCYTNRNYVDTENLLKTKKYY